MARPRKPVPVILHAVKISRKGEYADIEYLDPAISSVSLKIGPHIIEMTDQDILDLHNRLIREREKMAARYHHEAVEIPPGKPQIKYSERCDQWIPKGDVLRCLIHDDNLELVVEIDGRDLSLREFGRMLTTHAGWGMRIIFVPDDEVENEPKIVVGGNNTKLNPLDPAGQVSRPGRASVSCPGTGKTDMTFQAIEDAFFFVSSAQPFEHTAVVHRDTGEAFFASEMAGTDEIPEDAEGSDDYLWVPHKKDLNLGKPLVMDFILNRSPDLYDQVTGIFRRKGAYGRFKGLLERKGLLEAWYAFEEKKTREALVRWCRENGLVLE